MANNIIQSDYKIKIKAKTDGITIQSQTPVSIRGETYSARKLVDLIDVDTSNLENGAMIVYDSITKNFLITTDIDIPGVISNVVNTGGLEVSDDNLGTVQIGIGQGNGIVVDDNVIYIHAGSSLISNTSGLFVKPDLTINSISLNDALSTISGGTGFTSYNTGDLLVGQGNTLSILSIGDGILQANGTQLYYSEIIDEGEF